MTLPKPVCLRCGTTAVPGVKPDTFRCLHCVRPVFPLKMFGKTGRKN